MSIIQLLPFDVSAKHSLWVKVKIKPTILTHMERRIKYLIRISTGRDVSFHRSHQRECSYLIQIPPRAFSHRSSSHVLPYEDLGTHYWALFIPRLYSQRMVFILTPFGREDKTLRVSFSLELITMLRADNPMVGRVGFEPTHL